MSNVSFLTNHFSRATAAKDLTAMSLFCKSLHKIYTIYDIVLESFTSDPESQIILQNLAFKYP